jgi:hypothetical protein
MRFLKNYPRAVRLLKQLSGNPTEALDALVATQAALASANTALQSIQTTLAALEARVAALEQE